MPNRIINKNWGNYGKKGRPPKGWKPPYDPILKIKRKEDGKKFIITFD